MRGLMGGSAEQDFIFEDGFYPRLRHMDERPGRLAASPILLYPGENADSVTHPFYVDTNYGVRWYVDEITEFLDIVRIEGNLGYVRHPVKETFTVRVEARKEGFSKYVDLIVPASRYVYQDLRSDTVCPGDSVLMVRSYARNGGWNYEAVRTDTAQYDTIYRMYLHHHPTYREVVHRAAVERDSLPYIHGRDTIRQFGLTEVGRYLTAHGCDSVEYVQLDTLYIHRERHFHDTLGGCAGDTLRWRGREITRAGEYTDTVADPYRGGTDSIHHLRAYIYPAYSQTHTDSCHIEELPYTVGGRAIQDFGSTAVPLLTEHGCDSTVSYNLVRRWRHYRVRVETRGSGTASVRDTTLREDGSLWLTLTASACHRLDSLRVNGADVPARERYLVENLRGECAVVAVFSPSVPGESALTLEVCADSLPVLYNGREYGAGVHEVRLHTAAGCDSVVHLRVVGRENTATLSVRDTIEPPCGERVMSLTYAVESGGPRSLRVSFDAAARAAGFRDTALAIGGGGGRVLLPLPEDVEPGRYGLVLYQADGSGCHARAGSLGFEVRYPSDIIVQKWNDVLAVLSSEYNGGYGFSGYRWYRNGEPIEGETRPYLHVKPYLRYGDTYAVLLERASDGLRLLSCVYKARRAPGEAVLHLAPNPSRAGEGVHVTVEDRPKSSGHMEVYDGMGRRIYRAAFEKGTHLLRIDTPGTYLVRAISDDGRWTASGKMVIL